MAPVDPNQQSSGGMFVLITDITDRVRAEAARHRAEDRYRQLIEGAVEIIYTMDERGYFNYTNPATLELSGYTLEEFVQFSYLDLALPSYRSKLKSQFLRQVANKEQTSSIVLPFISKQGKTIWFTANCSLMWEGDKFIGFHVISRDMTKQKEAEIALQESETKFRSLADHSPNMIFINSDGKIVYVNERCEEVMGYTREEFYDPAFDFTKLIEEKLLRSQRLESIGTLAGGIAHDLNNVLGPILLATEVLQTKVHDKTLTKILDLIYTSAQRGSGIINQILGFARGLERQSVNLDTTTLLKEIRIMVRETFPRYLQLRFKIPDDLWTIKGDPTQFHQVIMNLCINARDAMRKEGNLTVSAENVAIDSSFVSMNPEAREGIFGKLRESEKGEITLHSACDSLCYS